MTTDRPLAWTFGNWVTTPLVLVVVAIATNEIEFIPWMWRIAFGAVVAYPLCKDKETGRLDKVAMWNTTLVAALALYLVGSVIRWLW